MVKTLITGGTGFIGSAVAGRLIRGSESVKILSRDPLSVSRERRAPGCEFAKGDIFHESSLLEAMKDCDAVVNAVQFENAPFQNRSKGLTYERVDGEGTVRQVEAAKKAGVKRFIYFSGAGTREGRNEPWFRAKARAEKAVQESGIEWTIFRPSWAYGPGDRSLNKFATFARILPFVPIIGTGKEIIQPVFVEDLAEAVVLSLNQSKTYGRIFEIGGPQELSMRRIVQTMLRVMGKKRLIVPQPKALMKLIATFVQFLPGPLRTLTPEGIDFITMEEKVDNAALLEALQLRLTPLEAGLKTYLSASIPNSFASVIQRTS